MRTRSITAPQSMPARGGSPSSYPTHGSSKMYTRAQSSHSSLCHKAPSKCPTSGGHTPWSLSGRGSGATKVCPRSQTSSLITSGGRSDAGRRHAECSCSPEGAGRAGAERARAKACRRSRPAAPANDLATVLCCWDGFPLLATAKGIRVPTGFLPNLRCSFSDLKESGPPLPMFIMAMTPPVTSSCDAAGAEAFPC